MQHTRILVVEDDPTERQLYLTALQATGYVTEQAASLGEALELLGRINPDLVLADHCLGKDSAVALVQAIQARTVCPPVIMMSGSGDVQGAVDALREGACDYLVKPLSVDELLAAVHAHLGRSEGHDGDPVAEDVASRRLLDLATRAARSDATVMISGPSGAGKEVMARYLHTRSPRSAAPFVAINCAAIPDTMLEATLFGYERGAFTGANKAMPGKFEQAQGGTLLLDEISEMQLDLQAKLLRVLQERQVERLGAQHTIELDIRIIATSNRDLPAEVAAGRFREDLFYRLSVMPLRVAPLSERPADILPLARTALKAHAPEAVFSEAAIARLLEHDWPGNVRELHNVVQRASILAEGRVIDVRHLLFDLPTREHRSAANRISNAEEGGLRQHLRDEEVDRVLHALGHHPSRRAAAGALGISERTLRYKVARLRDEGVAIPLARQA